jgi:pre-peptidase
MTPYAPTQRARSPRAARVASLLVAAAAVLAASVVPAGAATYTITPNVPLVVAVTSAGGTSRANFTGTAGQRVAVRATNTSILSGKIRLQDSSGNVLRSSGLNTGGAWLDMVTLPADDTYSIIVDASGTNTGSTTVTLYNEPADPTTSLTSGVGKALVTTTPGQNAAFTFDGTAGWNMSLRLSNVSTPVLNIIVKNPDGTTLMPALGVVGSKWIEPLDLPQTGTYTIKIDPQSFAKGSQTLTAWTFHGDQVANTAADSSTHIFNLNTPGQNASTYVSATSGDRLSFTFTTVTGAPGKMWIKNPDGTVLVPTQTLSGNGAMVEPIVVSQTGEYHIFVNPAADDTGTVNVRAHTVPADIVQDVAADGTPNAMVLGTPGQNGRFRFSGSAGQSVSVNLSSSVADTDFQLLKPNGNVLTSGSFDASGDFIDPITLPVDGTYKLVLDPQSYFVGTVTATIYDVPADATAAGAIGSTTVNTVVVPGQNGVMTFAGTAGQRVSLTASAVSIPSSVVWIERPNGSTFPQFVVLSSGQYMSPVTLPQTGTYTIHIDPQGNGTGHMSLDPEIVPGDPVYPIVANGVLVSGTNGGAGQNALFTFTGSANQKISLVVSNSTLGSAGVSIQKPDGTTLVSSFSITSGGGYVDTTTLPVNGTYTIKADPFGTTVGSVDMRLYTVPGVATGTIAPNGPTANIATTAPGQSAKLTFTGNAGWNAVLKMAAGSACTATVSMTAPNGSTKLSPTTLSPNGQASVSLSANGTYTVTIDPQGSCFGTHQFTLTH